MFAKIIIALVFLFCSCQDLQATNIDLSNQTTPLSSKGEKTTMDYKKLPDDFWKKHLSPDVYAICRQQGTERAGSGKYDKFYEKGIYYCACCGGDHPLFNSTTKFDSGTGWPSFWDFFSPQSVTLQEDHNDTLGSGSPRIEVLCSRCGSHLGHVFDDGPKEHTGKRYCMNSPALLFAPEGTIPKNGFDADALKGAS